MKSTSEAAFKTVIERVLLASRYGRIDVKIYDCNWASFHRRATVAMKSVTIKAST